MRSQLFLRRQKRPVTGWHGERFAEWSLLLLPLRLSFHRKRHGRLSTRHRQITLRQDLGIEQCAAKYVCYYLSHNANTAHQGCCACRGIFRANAGIGNFAEVLVLGISRLSRPNS